MEHMEHRWGERLKVELPVRIWTGYGSVGAGQVVDLSVSGAFIATRLQVPLLSPVNVVFRARRYNGRLRESPVYVAHVVRREANGFGIEWFDFATEDVIAVTHPEATSARTWQEQGLSNLSPPQGRKLKRGAKTEAAAGPTWLSSRPATAPLQPEHKTNR